MSKNIWLYRAYKLSQIIRHKPTGFLRVFPDFLIIGAPRSGTTSLYNYMCDHPSIIPALWKELKFFTLNYNKGDNWYRSNFPSSLLKNYFIKNKKMNFITGESSPHYLYHPFAPKRIFKTIPKVKMIIILRNPVDRLHSGYWKAVQVGREKLSIEDGIKKQMNEEPNFMKGNFSENNGGNFSDFRVSYLWGGIYVDGIKRFFNVFPKEQFLILKSEDFFENPELILHQVTDFLNLPSWKLKDHKKYNFNKDKTKIDSSLRKILIKFYEPHNQRLYKLLDHDFGWN